MKDSLKYLDIHIILLIKSPSNFPIYRRDSPIFYTYKSRGVLKIILALDLYPKENEINSMGSDPLEGGN